MSGDPVEWQPNDDLRSFAKGTADGHAAANRLNPVSQASETRPAAEVGASDTIVVDRENKASVIEPSRNLDSGGACMFGGVSRRFRRDEVGGHFGLIGQAFADYGVQRDRDGGTMSKLA